jgi:hypothetical protein
VSPLTSPVSIYHATVDLRRAHFISQAVSVHGSTYSYDLVDYVNARTKVNIFCPLHGCFQTTPDSHISRKTGCPKCANKRNGLRFKKPIDLFLSECNRRFLGYYDYNEVKYTNNKTKIAVICPLHGRFLIAPSHHLEGHGCPICGQEKSNWTRFLIPGHELASATLYFVAITRLNETFLKIGVTTRTVEERFRRHGDLQVRVIHSLQSTPPNVLAIEQEVLRTFADHSYYPECLRGQGATECFSMKPEVLLRVCELIDEFSPLAPGPTTDTSCP